MIRPPAPAVALFGAGRMGSQIGCEYALGGHAVTWVARDPRRAQDAVARALDGAEAVGLVPAAAAAAARRRIAVVDALDAVEALGGPVALVVESLPEQLELKAELLAPAAARWPDAIVASNTSSLEITRLGEALGAAARTVGTHYWNPPLLMPLVEVVAGTATAPEVVTRVTALLLALGKRPVSVARDVPGFVWNRLQFALLREALWLVEQGVATPETVDEVVRDGLARRWRLTGPFATAELGGLATFAQVAETLFPQLSDAHDAAALRDWVPRAEAVLADLARRRDAGLLAELRAPRD